MKADLWLTLTGPTEYKSLKYSTTLPFVPAHGMLLEIDEIEFNIKHVMYSLTDGALSLILEDIRIATHEEFNEFLQALLEDGWVK